MCCHTLHQKGSDLPIVQTIRQMQKLVRRVISALGVASKWRNAIGNAIPDLELRDTVADTFDTSDTNTGVDTSDTNTGGSDTPATNIYGASIGIPKSTPEGELAAWLLTER